MSPAPTPNHDGFTVLVTATVKPDRLDDFLTLFNTAVERTSDEPECLSFEVFRFPDEPNRLRWLENWSKPVAWFMEHQITKPYIKELMASMEPMMVKEKEVEIMERFGGGWARVREGVYQTM